MLTPEFALALTWICFRIGRAHCPGNEQLATMVAGILAGMSLFLADEQWSTGR